MESTTTDLITLPLQRQIYSDYPKNALISNALPVNSINVIEDIKEFFSDAKPEIWDNMCIAGGAIAGYLFSFAVKDFDIFLHGSDPKKLLDLAKYLEEYIYNKLDSFTDHRQYSPTVFGYDKVIKILGYMSFDIILVAYPNIKSVLCEFDLDACKFAFDGKNILTIPEAMYSYKGKCMKLTNSKISKSYPFRLAKYYNRGIHLIIENPKLLRLFKEHQNFQIYNGQIIFSYHGNVMTGNKKCGYVITCSRDAETSDYATNPMRYMSLDKVQRLIASAKDKKLNIQVIRSEHYKSLINKDHPYDITIQPYKVNEAQMNPVKVPDTEFFSYSILSSVAVDVMNITDEGIEEAEKQYYRKLVENPPVKYVNMQPVGKK